MLSIPSDTEAAAQRAEARRISRLAATSPKKKLLTTTRPPATPCQNGDRGNADDDAADTLPVYCRFKDLREAKIASNWPQLLRMIDLEGFPKGVWLSSNIRAWEIGLVRRWLAERPTARKKIVLHKQKAEEAEA
jgi:hypothetical protein